MEISPICFLCLVIIFLTEIIVLGYEESHKSKKYNNKLEMTKFEINIGNNFHKIIEAKTKKEAIKIAWELWKKEQKNS